MNIETNILYTWDDLIEFRDYVESSEFPYIVLDTETDNRIEKLANLYGIGIAFEGQEAFYIPIRKQDGSKYWSEYDEERIASWIQELCQSKKLIGHNILYDILVLQRNWGYDLTPYIYSDTILQKHAIDEERPFGLKEVAVKYLGAWADKAQDALYANIETNGGATTKENVEMFKANTEVLGEYCAYDCILTKQLFDIFEERIIKEGLSSLFYEEEIMPLYKEVTIPMKQKGFTVDIPYFTELDRTISTEIGKLQKTILEELFTEVNEYEEQLLNKDYPIKRTGLFPKYYAEFINFELPKNKNGAITLAKKEIEKFEGSNSIERIFINWLKGNREIENEELTKEIQRHWFFTENPEENSIFNLNSNNHLKWLFFDKLGETPLSTTETGAPQVDDDFLDSIKDSYPWVNKLIDYKKLSKLRSTYIEGVLERQIDGIIYSSFIQFGPPSGRYASKNPNLQNLPRVKEDDSGLSPLVLEYVNSIKKGFIAPEGYVIVNADYSQLEPRAFAEACEDPLLQYVFKNKEDLYGAIAKNIWNLDCTANEVKKKYNEYRQKAKIIALAVVYGAEAGRISKLMGITYNEAQEIIDNYLNSYPGLRFYMNNCNDQVCTNGYVKTKFGRIRHLPEAKRLYKYYGMKLLDGRWAKQNGLDEIRWKFKNNLNLAKNFPIQGVAAHIVNRASIAMSRKFSSIGLDATIVAQVHDEITCIAKKEEAEQVRAVMKDCMENTTKLEIPLIADPLIGANWAEAK